MVFKRKFLTFAFLIFSFKVFSQEEVPALLKGVWKNSSRYFVFDSGYVSDDGGAIPQAVLRSFYTWYDDRAAESSLYSEKNPRNVNNTTSKNPAQEISIKYVPLTDELFLQSDGKGVLQDDGSLLYANGITSGAWNLEIKYPNRKEIYNVPVAVIGDKLFLKFVIRQSGEAGLSGFWKDSGNASGILISPPVSSKELLSYFSTDSAVYQIRYWKTDMEYDSSAQAFFSDSGSEYSVPKHLVVAGQIFTCVTGRRTKIRSVKKISSFPADCTFNSVLKIKSSNDLNGIQVPQESVYSTICAFGEPYLTLEKGKSLEEILAENLKKTPPPPQPLFPPHGILDFDWSIIEDPPKDWNRRILDLGK